ncbi:MAG: M12 family metallo-peptidase [Candidatus Competibacteraceae bacterium]
MTLAVATGSFALTSVAQNAPGATPSNQSPSGSPQSAATLDNLPALFVNSELSASGVQQRSGATSQARVGYYARRFNRQLIGLPLQSKASFDLPRGARYEIVYDRRVDHPSGNTTWIGHVQGYGDDYRTIITVGQTGVSGRILTPDGDFIVESDQDGEWLIDVQASGLTAVGPGEQDALIPPPEALDPIIKKKHPPQGLSAEPTDNADEPASVSSDANSCENLPPTQDAIRNPTTINVMILYTPGMVDNYGNNLSTRLDQLVAIGNQAYLDSGVAINLRVVHTQQVDYSDRTTNTAALNALTKGRNPALADVAYLRNFYGADLVSLVRPFNVRTSGGSCGVAWLGGANGQAISRYSNLAYSVVSDGTDAHGRYYCLDLSFVHELSHNMGSAHDRAHADTQGACPYSYGYGIEGTFGTVMSYINPRIGQFSNPNIFTCKNLVCGTVNENNALSLNNTRNDVANFRPPVSTLTVVKSGGGRVFSSPAGIRCGRDCNENYPIGTDVTLTAIPARGHEFAGWGGACTGTSISCTVKMTAAQAVSATFK